MSNETKDKPGRRKPVNPARAERLAASLRANLKRRKDAGKTRDDAPKPDAGTPSDDQG